MWLLPYSEVVQRRLLGVILKGATSSLGNRTDRASLFDHLAFDHIAI